MKNNTLKLVILLQSCVLLPEQQRNHQENNIVFPVAEENCHRALIYIKKYEKKMRTLSYI